MFPIAYIWRYARWKLMYNVCCTHPRSHCTWFKCCLRW